MALASSQRSVIDLRSRFKKTLIRLSGRGPTALDAHFPEASTKPKGSAVSNTAGKLLSASEDS